MAATTISCCAVNNLERQHGQAGQQLACGPGSALQQCARPQVLAALLEALEEAPASQQAGPATSQAQHSVAGMAACLLRAGLAVPQMLAHKG